jgi:hypothetical protein
MQNAEKSIITPAFYTDKDIARRLRMSPEWVRGQRHKRRNGLPHDLNINPRYIGGSVRYVVSEVEEYIASVAA